MIRSNNVIIKNRVEKLRAWGKNKNFNIKNEQPEEKEVEEICELEK